MNFIENESEEKLRGAYYTDAAMAQYLVRWALEAGAESVLEPSCGDGAFLSAITEMCAPRLRLVVGCELVEQEARKAKDRLRSLPRNIVGDVVCDDFLAWSLDQIRAGAAFDAVVGNPPFIRYQYLDGVSQARAEELFDLLGLPFTRHTNAWVPFVLASLSLLRPGGRLAMVVPSEILHVLHAQGLRTHLLRACRRVVIVDPEDIWFKDTLQGVCLLFAERGDDDGAPAEVSVVPVRGEVCSLPPAGEIVASVAGVSGAYLDRKWTLALLRPSERALLADIAARPGYARFSTVSEASVGIITGANKFFLVPDAIVRDFGLEDYAHPMFGRSEHVAGVIYDEAQHEQNRRMGLPTNFIWFDNERPLKKLPVAVQRYIARGESEDLHTRFKCRTRSPWYAVPSVFTAPVGMLKRSHDFPRLVLNSAGAFTTDTAYRVNPRKGIAPAALVATFVNSLTALSAELEGRHYGGGVLELVPSEIARLWLPPVAGTERGLKDLNQDIAGRCLRSEEIIRRNDARVLNGALDPAEQRTLFEAWQRLRARRQRVTASDIEGTVDGEVAQSTSSRKRALGAGGSKRVSATRSGARA